jgi:DNA-binding response OmpR family regulator
MAKILLVEDEDDIAKGIEINLRKEGFVVSRVARGDEAVGAVLKLQPDLVVLDVMLPGASGLDVCRMLRQRGIDVPIIMLTARAEELDRVIGLEIGADDYMTKPFGIRELVARIRVRLRRPPTPKPPARERPVRYRISDLDFDFERRIATRAGQAVDMSPKEFELLRILVQHRGEVVTRDTMLNDVWGYESSPTTRTVDTHIVKLRQKIEPDPANPVHILSVYGEGYKFVD